MASPVPATPSASGQEFKLFVGQLPPGVTEEELRIVFSTYGTVNSIHVMQNSKLPTGHISAFVNYASKQAGDDAIQVLENQYRIREGPEHTPIRVSWARSSGVAATATAGGQAENKLFVGALPPGITEEELRIVFGSYGEVAGIHVMHNTKSQTGHISAFVTYVHRQAGDDAIRVLDNQYKIREGPEQVPIKVSWARPAGSVVASRGGPGGPKGGWTDYAKGVAPGGPRGWDDGKGGAWGPPGPSPWGGAPAWGAGAGWAKGWGGPPGWGGQGAYGGAYGAAAYGGAYAGAKGWDAGKGDAGKGPSTRLFVGNLPSDIEKQSLEFVFGSYGQVVHVHIMTGKSQSGNVCAIVEYAFPQQAETAILTLNEKYEIRPGMGPIIVRYAHPRGQ